MMKSFPKYGKVFLFILNLVSFVKLRIMANF